MLGVEVGVGLFGVMVGVEGVGGGGVGFRVAVGAWVGVAVTACVADAVGVEFVVAVAVRVAVVVAVRVAVVVGVAEIVAVMVAVAVRVGVIVGVAVAVEVAVTVEVAVIVGVAVGVGVAVLVDVLVEVAVAVGVGTMIPVGTSKIASALNTGDPPGRFALAIAMKVGEATPCEGAARSPNATVKPSWTDIVFSRWVIPVGSVMVGATKFCAA
jgi:hypothetical protein